MSILERTPTTVVGPSRRSSGWAEASALLLAPVVVVLGLIMARPDLTGGQLALRCGLALVATVPAYLWLRGRSPAAGASAVVLTSPVLLAALLQGSADGVASAALLMGLPALACWTTGVRRVLVRGLAGLALGVAACAGPGAVPFVLAALVAFAAGAWSRHTGLRRARTRRVAVDLVAVGSGLVVAVLGAALLGHEVGVPVGAGPVDPSALLAPPVVVSAWVVLWWRRRRSSGEWAARGDAVVVLATALGWLAVLLAPSSGATASVWVGVSLTTALLVTGLSSSWPTRPSTGSAGP